MRAAFFSTEEIFRLAVRRPRQFFQTGGRDAAAFAGEKGEDFARRDIGRLRPFAGTQMACDHEGTKGIALFSNLDAARRGDFAHQHFWFGVG